MEIKALGLVGIEVCPVDRPVNSLAQMSRTIYKDLFHHMYVR
jgi:hypothetical protein